MNFKFCIYVMSLICEMINIIIIVDENMLVMYEVINYWIIYLIFVVIESEVLRSKLMLNNYRNWS